MGEIALLIEFTHKVTNLLQAWRMRLQVTKKLSERAGRLPELKTYWVKIPPHLHTETCPMFYMVDLCDKPILRTNPVLLDEKFLSLVLHRNAIVLQHLTIQFLLYYLSKGRLQEVKNNTIFQT